MQHGTCGVSMSCPTEAPPACTITTYLEVAAFDFLGIARGRMHHHGILVFLVAWITDGTHLCHDRQVVAAVAVHRNRCNDESMLRMDEWEKGEGAQGGGAKTDKEKRSCVGRPMHTMH